MFEPNRILHSSTLIPRLEQTQASVELVPHKGASLSPTAQLPYGIPGLFAALVNSGQFAQHCNMVNGMQHGDTRNRAAGGASDTAAVEAEEDGGDGNDLVKLDAEMAIAKKAAWKKMADENAEKEEAEARAAIEKAKAPLAKKRKNGATAIAGGSIVLQRKVHRKSDNPMSMFGIRRLPCTKAITKRERNRNWQRRRHNRRRFT